MLGDVGDQTKSFRFKSERLDHRHPVSVAHRLDGADAADGAQADDGDMLAVRPFLMRSATRGRDAAAMIERRADEIVARFRGTERGMGREGDVFQRRQDVAGRQGL